MKHRLEWTPTSVRRWSKIAVTAAIAFLLTLVVFGNLTDYDTNYQFIHHVLSMDTIDAGTAIRYRAIEDTFVQHALYVVIIALEIVALALCSTGICRMIRHADGSAANFVRAKAFAVMGLTLAYLILQVAIFAVGNEWFGMWRSKEWNGVESIFRTLVMILGALIYVGLPEASDTPTEEIA